VAGGAEVPLHAAGEPGAGEREGGGLEHRVAVEQFTAGRLVDQRVQPAAEAGQHGGADAVVLDHERVEVGGGAVPAVAVQDADGQDGAQWRVTELPGHVRGQSVTILEVEPVHLVERAQCGQRVLRAEGRGREMLTAVRRTVVAKATLFWHTWPPSERRPSDDHGTGFPPR